MTLSLDEFRQAIRSEMAVDPNGLIWDDDDLNTFITLAHKKVQQDFNFGLPQNVTGLNSFNTSAGVLEYALPSDYVQTQMVKLGNNPLGLTDKFSLLSVSELNNSGQPSRYYVYGLLIGFDQVPDQSYAINHFYKKLVPPPDETDGSILPEDVNRPITMYSKYLAWNSPSGKANDAAQALGSYEREIAMVRMQFGFFNPTAMTWGLARPAPRVW